MPGENISAHSDAYAVGAKVEADLVIAYLADGRIIATPLAWYPRLLAATAEQLLRVQVVGGGFGIRWPELDEDLSIEGMLRGETARAAAPIDRVLEDTLAAARAHARQWIKGQVRSKDLSRFPAQDFNALMGQYIAAHPNLSPDVRAAILNEAQKEALEFWDAVAGRR